MQRVHICCMPTHSPCLAINIGWLRPVAFHLSASAHVIIQPSPPPNRPHHPSWQSLVSLSTLAPLSPTTILLTCLRTFATRARSSSSCPYPIFMWESYFGRMSGSCCFGRRAPFQEREREIDGLVCGLASLYRRVFKVWMCLCLSVMGRGVRMEGEPQFRLASAILICSDADWPMELGIAFSLRDRLCSDVWFGWAVDGHVELAGKGWYWREDYLIGWTFISTLISSSIKSYSNENV